MTVYNQISENKIKTFFIMFVFILIFSSFFFLLGKYFDSPWGYFFLGFFISILSSIGSYFYGDKLVLMTTGAIKADKKRYFNFYTVAENLSIASGLPMPALYVIVDPSPNAFATGRDPHHGVICATTGLLTKLNRTELEGVLAHEYGHIKNYDIRLMSVVSVLVGSIALLADWFLRIGFRGRGRSNDNDNGQIGAIFLILGIIFAILSPIIAQLIQLAISRRREFTADATSVAITRQPNGLISALKKIAADTEPLEAANKATAHLYIENPFKNKTKSAVGIFSNLFNTHPPVEERIAALTKME